MNDNILFNDPLEETLNDANRRCRGGRHIDDGAGICVECQQEID